MAADLLLRNVRPLGGEATDILIEKGRIVWQGTLDAIMADAALRSAHLAV